jgi:type VI secretion system secreted protein VgrG
VRIAGGNIEIHAPGKIDIKGGTHSFEGPTSLSKSMNEWPNMPYDDEFVLRHHASGRPMANRRFELTRADGAVISGRTDANGGTGLQKSSMGEGMRLRFLPEGDA